MAEERRMLDVVAAAAAGTRVGQVAALLDDAILVACEPDGAIVACDLLETAAAKAPALAEGETVLVVVPEGGGGRGVVLGRVLRRGAPSAASDGPPEEILLEATKGLTLKVGEGSITLREDGKVLIRGRDLVSHAKRTNRIRGGTVAIN
jgi:hypothetical protein